MKTLWKLFWFICVTLNLPIIVIIVTLIYCIWKLADEEETGPYLYLLKECILYAYSLNLSDL